MTASDRERQHKEANDGPTDKYRVDLGSLPESVRNDAARCLDFLSGNSGGDSRTRHRVIIEDVGESP
jgi:hypothetical protein